MSNFMCEKCGKPCIDSPLGYITGCEHYPADINRDASRRRRMYAAELRSIINDIVDDIGCDGGTRTGSHKIPSSVNFYIDDDDSEYELIEIETDRLGGCGCAVGITFRLKKL